MRTDCTDCGKCCEYVLLPLKDDDHARWAAYHGINVDLLGGKWFAKIDKVCMHLSEEKTCLVYNTPAMPKLCQEFLCRALSPRGWPVEGVE